MFAEVFVGVVVTHVVSSFLFCSFPARFLSIIPLGVFVSASSLSRFFAQCTCCCSARCVSCVLASIGLVGRGEKRGGAEWERKTRWTSPIDGCNAVAATGQREKVTGDVRSATPTGISSAAEEV